jgi:hypothetical protein
MDIIESIERYLSGGKAGKSERARLTRARDEIVRLRAESQSKAEDYLTIFRLKEKLRKCAEVMECNDPTNYKLIFGTT